MSKESGGVDRPDCSLPGCSKPVALKPEWVSGSRFKKYCGLKHAAYHERDQQTAAWLREQYEKRIGTMPDGDRYLDTQHIGAEAYAEAIEAGEHHR